MPPMMPPGMPVAGVGAAFKVNYFTRAIAVDFRGGERLRGRRGNSLGLAAPGEILLLDADGNLVVHDELDDKPAYDEVTRTENAAAGAEEGPHPAGVHGGAATHGGAMDKLFNHDPIPKKRPPVRGAPKE